MGNICKTMIFIFSFKVSAQSQMFPVGKIHSGIRCQSGSLH